MVNRQDCCGERIAYLALNFLDAAGQADRPRYAFYGAESSYTIAGGWLLVLTCIERFLCGCCSAAPTAGSSRAVQPVIRTCGSPALCSQLPAAVRTAAGITGQCMLSISATTPGDTDYLNLNELLLFDLSGSQLPASSLTVYLSSVLDGNPGQCIDGGCSRWRCLPIGYC